MNASPTAFGPGATRTGQVNNRGLADLLPALKVLSQVAVRSGAIHVSLLDLTRQSIVFEQNAGGDLDWPLLRASLVQADPNKIDARSLAGTEDATFPFWSPDGQSLAFFSNGKLKTVELNGGPVQVVCEAQLGRGGAWSDLGPGQLRLG